MANHIEYTSVPELELKPGAEFHGFNDTPDWHVFVCLFALLVGCVTILLSLSLAWRAYRKSRPCDGYRKPIILAITAIVASSLVDTLLTIADWLDLFSDGTLGLKDGGRMFTLVLAHQARLLGLSLGLASLGVVATLLLPSRAKTIKESPPIGPS
jgi:H+/Cl- antiporter ClcA